MTPTRGKKRLASSSHEQRRRRLRVMASCASSMGSPPVGRALSMCPPSQQQWRRDGNNNATNITLSRRLAGAFIYKTGSDGTPEDDLMRLHVFDQYEVKLRRDDLECKTIERIASDFAGATTGKSTYVTSVYWVQKQVPIGCFSECLLELERSIFYQNYRINVNFQRKYVEAVRHEYGPVQGGSLTYKSTASLNLLGN